MLSASGAFAVQAGEHEVYVWAGSAAQPKLVQDTLRCAERLSQTAHVELVCDGAEPVMFKLKFWMW